MNIEWTKEPIELALEVELWERAAVPLDEHTYTWVCDSTARCPHCDNFVRGIAPLHTQWLWSACKGCGAPIATRRRSGAMFPITTVSCLAAANCSCPSCRKVSHARAR